MRFLAEHQLVPYAPAFPPGRRWLFFAPHPDDETVGAGATLAQAAAQGVSVRVVVLTDGQAQGDGQERRQEALAATKALGLWDVHFWSFRDRGLASAPLLVGCLWQELKCYVPELVFFPSPLELHPDHRALAWVGQKVLRRWSLWGLRRRPPFWVAFYEVGSALWPNLLVAADAAWEQKRHALSCYRSQLAVRPYGRVAEGLAAFRTLTLEAVSWAEGFHLLSVRQLVRLSFTSCLRRVGLPPT